jgi:hypothetical protein
MLLRSGFGFYLQIQKRCITKWLLIFEAMLRNLARKNRVSDLH